MVESTYTYEYIAPLIHSWLAWQADGQNDDSRSRLKLRKKTLYTLLRYITGSWLDMTALNCPHRFIFGPILRHTLTFAASLNSRQKSEIQIYDVTRGPPSGGVKQLVIGYGHSSHRWWRHCDSMPTGPVLHTFMEDLNLICRTPEVASDILLCSIFVNVIKFSHPGLHPCWDSRFNVAGDGILTRLSL